MPHAFVIRTGTQAGRTLLVQPGETRTLGRLKTCDLALDDEAVSRRHCTIRGGETTCEVLDLRSANGTFVNEQRIARADLAPGDRLRLGSTVLEYLTAAAPAVADAPFSTVLAVVPDERDQSVVRRTVDPVRPEFLAVVLGSAEAPVVEVARRYLAAIHDVSERLAVAPTIEGLYDAVLDAVVSATGGDRAAVLVRAEGEGEVRLAAVRARNRRAGAADMVVSRTVINDVLERGLSALVSDALDDSRYRRGESIVRQGIRSVMCAPMRTSDRVLGVLYVDSQSAHEFAGPDLELLAAIGNQAGLAVHRMRLLEELERLFLDVMKAMAATIDAKDGYTHRHSERVAALGLRLAREMGLDAETRALVELSGLLHDVGKIGVPDAILNKPGRLSDEEFAEIKRHTLHGVRILSHIHSGRIAALLPGVRSHHERWDGAGYPDGLAGEQIPLLGRVLAVADFVDALTSDRSYRAGLPLEQALRMLQELSGRAFDPAVVAAALALHARGELTLPREPAPKVD